MKKPVHTYHAYRGRSRIKRLLLAALLALAAVAVLLLLAARILFRRELGIMDTIRRLDTARPAYTMEIVGDYGFEAFLRQGGARSDSEVAAYLTSLISRGLYAVPVTEGGHGCSVISAAGPDGSHVWGRNFDWTESVPVILRHVPEDGYASVSTCDFQNVAGQAGALPEGFANRLLAIAALYVPLDGVNEAGLCVADLEVNEGGMPVPATGKPDLTITTAIRLLLNRAATVDEALALLEQYDIHASGGISHHLAVSDASGASVAVEFTPEGCVAVPTQVVTNFNLSNGAPAAGGVNSRERYQTLCAFYEERGGVLTDSDVWNALERTAQAGGEQPTQWSLVWSQGALAYCFDGAFGQPYSQALPW